MILQSIISQSPKDLQPQPPVVWNANTNGNYKELLGLNQIKTTVFSPIAAGNKAYNHHSHVIEFMGEIHIMYSTANDDEEEPGQYVRHQKSIDGGITWTSSIVLLESQDDIAKGWSVAGRVCIPAGFAIANGNLYAIVDINDKGASNTSRTGVGVLAVKINDASFDAPVWIENVDGTAVAPISIVGFPSYFFDNNIRTPIRSYLSIPNNFPTWYYSVPQSDILYTRDVFEGNLVAEPSTTLLPNSQYLRLYRLLVGNSNTKIAQTSNDGIIWNDLYDTGIPDHPSRTKFLNFNCYMGVIGNNNSEDRTPLFIALSQDGLTYELANIYNIDSETNLPVFPGIYKDTGVQYPDAIQLQNGKICVVYSVNKEDIKVSIFNKPILI